MDYPTRFEFKDAEAAIYAEWEKKGYFKAKPDSPKNPFTIVIPPPNITGSLHMGHALNNSIQDLLTRFERMRGREALYLPGTDHAGIATQYVVEKQLKKEENKTRFDLGREKFVERVWKWKEQSGGTILMQLRRMGFSCDWEKTRFTLDPEYARAVLTVFVSLFKKGLIYRGMRLVNWCPSCKTALSDLEVVHPKEPESGHIWHIRYPIKGKPGEFITVATTRPETLLGDTAVAANPDDGRYKALVGATLILPVLNREIPLIADSYVDSTFGTGLVKITPAHDFNDYEVGERHKLAKIQVIDAAGKMSTEAGPFAGMDRFEARKKIVKQLEEEGLLEKVEPYKVSLGRCYRCSAVLEPFLSLQWYVSMKQLVVPAIRAVENGDIKFSPDRYKKTYLDWMYNIKDWCISRQLWWGHRIPIYYCHACGTAIAAVDVPSKCIQCGAAKLEQDEDVLDTWFSSALWPFATLGWPNETEELEKFYPTSTLVTSRDIINLWVARMIFMGYEFCGDKPYTNVVVHPQLQTIEGKRMSKSLGTGIDPLELIDEYGADALRYCLIEKCTGVQDIRFGLPHELIKKQGGTPSGRDDRSMVEARNFITKVWNACRFVLMNIKQDPGPAPADMDLQDRWILSKLSTTVREYTRDLEEYEFGRAAQRLFHFTWDDFCDYYIELSKNRLAEPRTQSVLLAGIDTILRLLHPLTPFVTEAIWQKLREVSPNRSSSIMISDWPEPVETWIDPTLEEQFESALQLVRGIRHKRRLWNVPPKEPMELAALRSGDSIKSSLGIIQTLSNASTAGTRFVSGSEPAPRGCVAIVASGATAYVRIPGSIDVSKHLSALRNELGKTEQRLEGLKKRLDDSNYRAHAPEEKLADDEDEAKSLEEKIKEVRSEIAAFESA